MDNVKKNPYKDVKQAKSVIRTMNRLGWPDTKGGITRLYDTLPDMQKEILLIGRFILKFKGWVFEMPTTADVIEVLNDGGSARRYLLFVEDEEG